MIRMFLGAIIAGALIVVFAAFWLSPGHTIAAEPRQCGTASWYGFESGTITASGERFHPNGFTAAMPSRMYLGRIYRVHYGHRSVVVRVNDYGPAARLHRIMDLSRGAAASLGLIGRGVGTVCLERIR